MSDSDHLELSAQDLMPSWVTNLEKSLQDGGPRQETRYDDRDGDQGRGGGRGKGSRGPRKDRDWDGDRRGGGGGGGRRRDDGARGKSGGRGRGGKWDRRSDDDRRPRRPAEEPLPEGITVGLEPTPNAAAALAQHIRGSGRTYALADLAKMVLGARERYQVRFRSDSGEKHPLYSCDADGSLWLSREEAVAHLLRSSAIDRYYQVEEVAVEAPKGNFSVVAVCGFTGQILGPPNHHEYQMNVARLHRERFADMPLERFKSRIEMKRDEETIEQWKALVSTRRQYRVRPEPLSEEAMASAEPDPAPDAESEATGESASAEAPATEAPIAEESAVQEAPSSESEPTIEAPEAEESESAETEATEATEASETEASEGETNTEEESSEVEPSENADDTADGESPEAETETIANESAPSEPEGEVLTSGEALERHFRKHFADEAVTITSEAVVGGNIPGRNLSRPLLGLLKMEVDRSRKSFPLTMIQHLCREFEKAGLKFFKRGKKALHVSVARPRAIENEEDFTERVREIVRFVRERPRAKVVDLLDALVSDYQKPPQGESFQEHQLTQAEHDVLADLRWLTMEGYVIEFPGSELVLGRTEPPPAPTPKKKKKARKKAKGPRSDSKPSSEETAAVETPETPVASTEAPAGEAAEVSTESAASTDSPTPEISSEPDAPSTAAPESDTEADGVAEVPSEATETPTPVIPAEDPAPAPPETEAVAEADAVPAFEGESDAAPAEDESPDEPESADEPKLPPPAPES